MSQYLSSGAMSGGPGSGNPAGPAPMTGAMKGNAAMDFAQAGFDILGGFQSQQAHENTATLYQQQAQLDLREAGAKVLEEENRARAVMGAGNAAAAGSGVTQAGSPTLAARATAENANMTDVYNRYTGNLHRVEDLYQAKLQKYAGEQSLLGGYMNAGISAAEGAALIAL